MTAGELRQAVREDNLPQFLRTFCGTAVVFNGAPNGVLHRAEAVSAYVKGVDIPRSVPAFVRWGDWRTYLMGDNRRELNAPSPYTFRRGRRQTEGTIGRRGPGSMRGGFGDIPAASPPGDWVVVFGGWDSGWWEAPMEDAWRNEESFVTCGRELACHQIYAEGSSGVAWRKGWRAPGEVNGGNPVAFLVQPGFMLCNVDLASIQYLVRRWGKPFAVWFAKRMNEARFLASRHRKQGVGGAFIGQRVVSCWSCGSAAECRCGSVRDTIAHLNSASAGRVYRLQRQADQINRQMEQARASGDVVERVAQACERAKDARFISAARFTGQHAHVFMGPFEFELDATSWRTGGGREYSWPAGRYRMPPVWLRIPWHDPASVQVLDFDGSPHPHGHVGAGGENGMPCLGGEGDGVRRRLVRYWDEDPYEFIMHWWNYMNQYNDRDYGIVGPIHTACELIEERGGPRSMSA